MNIQIELETGTSGVALSYFKPKDVLVASFLGGDIRIVDLNGNSFRKIKVTFTEIRLLKYLFQAIETVCMMIPVLNTDVLLARMVDGQSVIIDLFGDTNHIYTLERAVIGTAGLAMVGRNLQLLELVERDGESSDVMLAEVGITKPRPKLVNVLCRVCGSLLAGSHSFSRHRELHDGEVIACTECGAAFADHYFYRRHRVNCRHVCPFLNSSTKCQFKAQSSDKIKRHMWKKHRFDTCFN